MLNAAGANITGAGTPTVRIRGVGGAGDRGGDRGSGFGLGGDVSGLRGCVHDAIPDRVEAGTFLVAAACTGSTLELYPVVSAHLTATIDVLRAAGCDAEVRIRTWSARDAGVGVGSGSLARRAALERLVLTPPAGGARGLSAVDLPRGRTPGCPRTCSRSCACWRRRQGTSTIRETVFENRFSHGEELAKMGCDARRARTNARW